MEPTDHDLLIEIRGDVKRLVDTSADHEKRIRRLEWILYAIATVAGIAAGSFLPPGFIA